MPTKGSLRQDCWAGIDKWAGLTGERALWAEGAVAQGPATPWAWGGHRSEDGQIGWTCGELAVVEVGEGHSSHLCEGLVDQLRVSFPVPRTVGSHWKQWCGVAGVSPGTFCLLSGEQRGLEGKGSSGKKIEADRRRVLLEENWRRRELKKGWQRW